MLDPDIRALDRRKDDKLERVQKRLTFYAAVLPLVVNIGTVVYFFGRQSSTIEQLATTVKEVKDYTHATDARLRELEIKAAALSALGERNGR